MKGSTMAVAEAVIEILGTDSFADYERSVYDSYQEKAEHEIINTLNSLLSSVAFLMVLKTWGARCGCKFHGFRDVSIRLKSGRKRKIHSPVFLKATPKKKEVESRNVKKDDCGILALNYLALLKR
jgi:hypothetical protein